jgi:hypothetical protein
MAVLSPSLQNQLRDVFTALPRPVTLLVFLRTDDRDASCETCRDARELVGELASNSGGRVHMEGHDLDAHPAEARLYGIDKAPAIVVLGGESGRRDFGIRFFGSPAGYEFARNVPSVSRAVGSTIARHHAARA